MGRLDDDIRYGQLTTLDPEVSREGPLGPSDRAERFLEAASHECSKARRIYEVVGLVTGSDLLGLVLQPDFPEVPKSLPKGLHDVGIRPSVECGIQPP